MRTSGAAGLAGVRFRVASLDDVPALLALVTSAYRGESSRAGWTTEADLLDGQRTDAQEITEIVTGRDTLVLVAEAGPRDPADPAAPARRAAAAGGGGAPHDREDHGASVVEPANPQPRQHAPGDHPDGWGDGAVRNGDGSGAEGDGGAAGDGARTAQGRPGIIACCQLERHGSTAYFGLFAVRPARQAGGLGSAVLAEAERRARVDWGADRMEMYVISQRAELIAWYARRGYRPTGDAKPFPYGDERFGLPRRDDLAFTVLAKPLPSTGESGAAAAP